MVLDEALGPGQGWPPLPTPPKEQQQLQSQGGTFGAVQQHQMLATNAWGSSAFGAPSVPVGGFIWF